MKSRSSIQCELWRKGLHSWRKPWTSPLATNTSHIHFHVRSLPFHHHTIIGPTVARHLQAMRRIDSPDALRLLTWFQHETHFRAASDILLQAWTSIEIKAKRCWRLGGMTPELDSSTLVRMENISRTQSLKETYSVSKAQKASQQPISTLVHHRQ
jgi:hypothetical protein